jgi:hypothetical protein
MNVLFIKTSYNMPKAIVKKYDKVDHERGLPGVAKLFVKIASKH